MTNVVDLLEKIGQDAGLRYAAPSEIERDLNCGAIDPELRKAVLAADQRRIEELLGASTNVCCMVHVPDDDDEEDDDEPAEDDEEARALQVSLA